MRFSSKVMPAASNPPYQIPAGFFGPGNGGGLGKAIHVTGGGFFSIGTSAVTFVLDISFDSTISTHGISMWKTGAFTTTASVTNGAFYFDLYGHLSTLGNGATASALTTVGSLDWGTGNNAATAANAGYMMGAPNAPVGFNAAVPQWVDVWGTWSATTGSPTITLTNLCVWGLN